MNTTVISGEGTTFQVQDVTTRDTTCSPDSLFSSISISSSENERETWHHSANPRTTILLSLLYLALLTFFGSAVLLAEMRHHNPQTHNVQGFLTVLMLSSSAWMLWFAWTSAKNKKIKMYQDYQAGASWLKGGLCLFALATLVLDCLTLGYYYELHQCTPVLVTSFPIVQAVFTVIQVSLLSFYAKICIQEKQQLNRFGLMHALATNILMWMSVVLDESMKHLQEIYDIQKKKMNILEPAGVHVNSCVCTTDLCHIFSEGADYLHPFNIEFSLFSSTMLYVIWKNTGKTGCTAAVSGHSKGTLHINGAFVGLILGAFAISATFGVMISFGVLAKSPGTVPEALRIYYLFNSVLLSAMFIASVIGIITCRLQKGFRFDDVSKSVVRSLDITLLMGSSCGPLLVSVFSLVAIFFLHIEGNLYILDLCFSLCKTVQVLGQNLFITEALYSGPAQNTTTASNAWVYSISQVPAKESIKGEISNLPAEYDHVSLNSEHAASVKISKTLMDFCTDVPKNRQSRTSVAEITHNRHIVKEEDKVPFIRTRRKILQNISILLICYNISSSNSPVYSRNSSKPAKLPLVVTAGTIRSQCHSVKCAVTTIALCDPQVWILYAYGTRPHLVSQIEQSFYGFTLWVIIVKISLPLGIFYRMHSVASLFEAYCNICEATA
ncbi:proton channel OTOP2-like [Bufo gargarizans]|uniref:proton channel OTOP2-like n=1 Tax=Bufo gargarizans TaxID=30331 RepID=UPI001CF3FB5C|nr:proton channel OTOP2-like [Bufo gargarizans]